MSSNQTLIPYTHTDGQIWDHYFVDPRSQMIYFVKSHGGKKIKFSTKERVPNGVKAKRFANAEFDRKTGKSKVSVRSLIKEELKAWLILKESEGHKPDTMNNVRRAKKQIGWFWDNKLPNEITRDTFAEWCSWWRSEHPKIEMENAIKYFNNFCVYLHEKVLHGRPLLPSILRFQDPNRKKIKGKRARKKERVLTPEQFKQIHSSAPGEVEAVIVLFMYLMGARVEETMKLDMSRIILDVDIPLYRWTVDMNKSERIGEHALHPLLIKPMTRLRDQREAEGTDLFFPQKFDNKKALREQMIDWDSWRSRAKVDFHWTPHTMRHTCLTNLFNNPKNPQAVICKLYRTSLQTALGTYIKVTHEAMMNMRDSIEVEL